MLASNIANADTPGYKAKDVDFKSALANVEAQSGNTLTRTNSKHIQISTAENNADILYRVPNQSSLDGNTVDEQVEKSAFADNALRYQASITFLDGKFKGMIAALKGE
jgi:flagellar basal-body rod protein FlgB